MLVCPLCRIALGANDAVCPRDGHAAREVAPHAVPDTLLKRFQILEPFAHGEAGTLYLADEPETGRRGLLKILGPVPKGQAAERQRLRRELVKQATLESVHVGTPLATGETDGVTWVFREWLDGVSLGVRLSRGGALPQAEALAVAAQLASALDDLHRAGLLHRDIKPGHVFLQPTSQGLPRAILIDAGLSTPCEVEGRAPILGTPGYVAPEQLQGKLVSFRSDLYALGCVMYEMLTGQPAFGGANVEAMLAAQLSGELPPIPFELPNGVGALLKSLLAKDPQERPFSAQKLRRTLDPYLPDGAPVTRQPTATFATLPEERKSIAPTQASGTLRPPPPPSSNQASRIPPPPSAGVARPLGRSSLPPPPPPSSKKSADATQQIDLEQIVDMAHSKPRASVPPPPAPSHARGQDATQALDLDEVLEIVSEPSVVAAAAAAPAAPAAPAPQRPSADHTQPIRLEQILAVADTRKKDVPAPPPSARASVSAAAPDPTDALADIASEAVLSPVGVAAAAPHLAAQAPIVDVDQDDVSDAPPSDPAPAMAPANVGTAEPVSTKPEAELEPEAHAASHDDKTIADDIAPPDEHEDEADDAATIIAAAPERLPAKPGPSGKSTLLGMPAVSPQAAAALSGTAVATPMAVRAATSPAGPDSGQLTVPRSAADAIAEAERMAAADGSGPVLPLRSNRKLVVVAAAAVALLGVVGLGASMFGGDDADVTADTAKAADMSAEPTAAIAAKPAAPTPAVMPIAETPKAAEPTPTVSPLPVTTPAVTSTADEPKVASKESTSSRASKSSSRESSRESARESRDSRKSKSEGKLSDAERTKRWTEARDEARAHFAAKRYKQAAEAYERAAKYNPSHSGTFAGLGAARLQTGDARGAVQAYQKAVQLSPTTSGFHAALGKAYMSAGDKGRAKAAYKKALALDPNNTAAKQALAELR